MTGRVEAPSLVGSGAAVVAAFGSALLAGATLPASLLLGSIGIAGLAAGLVRGGRIWIDVGAFVVFAAVLVSALSGAPVSSTAAATIGAVLAWDVGHRAVGLGEQLGRDARTVRLETVHVAVSLLIGLGSAVLAYLAFTLAVGPQPVAVVILLVLAGAFLLVALGTRGGRYGEADVGE